MTCTATPRSPIRSIARRPVAGKLAEYGFEVSRGLGVTGVVGTLRRGSSHRSIALRADMDALPIHEQTGLPHASSQPGMMHACGHDGHTAMLLAAARHAASRKDLHGVLHVIFQPAEEVEGGARQMIEDGLFDQISPDRVFGMHNWPDTAPGSVAAPDGAMMSAFGTFDITIAGRGAHGAMPHQSADPVLAASQIVSSLQVIAARNVSPLDSVVVSVTKIHGGDAYNVIPEAVKLAGTTRWFTPEGADLIERRLTEVAQHVAAGFECRAEVLHERRYPATVNDAGAARFVRDIAAGAGFAIASPPPSMGAEDFSFMMERKPGCYIWLGARKEGENPMLHSPRFDFNDAVLRDGIRLWNQLISGALAA
ncbi:amidohydrolase [Tabrizicola sp.]|uniref:amidohydrolase n=1 Tax=Tabrizicola sp. TaxID=2005166 RepID=UPI002FDCB10E